MQKIFEIITGVLILVFIGVVLWQISARQPVDQYANQNDSSVETDIHNNDKEESRVPDEVGSEIIPPEEELVQPVACTMEARECPDGSFVGRTGPNCEFEMCPLEVDNDNKENIIIYESHPDIDDPILDCRQRGGVLDDCYGTCDAPYYCADVCLLACHVQEETGVLFGDEFSDEGDVICSPESKLAEVCTADYSPVCGLVDVQCVTTPCDPVPQTFSNACDACSQGNVSSYTAGACEEEPLPM